MNGCGVLHVYFIVLIDFMMIVTPRQAQDKGECEQLDRNYYFFFHDIVCLQVNPCAYRDTSLEQVFAACHHIGTDIPKELDATPRLIGMLIANSAASDKLISV